VSRPKRLTLPIAAAALCLAGTAASATAAPGADGVWVAGTVYDLVTTGPAPAGAAPRPLFVVSPIDPSSPLHPQAEAATHGFGAHDHVISLAGSTSFTGACDIMLVVPGPKAAKPGAVRKQAMLTPAGTLPLLSAARLGTRLVPLNSAVRIRKAQRLGFAKLVDTHTVIGCTASARTGA